MMRLTLARLLLFAPLLALLLVVPLAIADSVAAPASQTVVHGLAPLPNDEKVPKAMLPPGSFEPDPGPSDVIYPVQHLTIRFNHAKHLGKDVGATCKTCHGAANRSTSVADSLLPKGEACDACHSTDHSELTAVKAGGDASGQCAFCHEGDKPE